MSAVACCGLLSFSVSLSVSLPLCVELFLGARCGVLDVMSSKLCCCFWYVKDACMFSPGRASEVATLCGVRNVQRQVAGRSGRPLEYGPPRVMCTDCSELGKARLGAPCLGSGRPRCS